jgi:hypothetical protein
MTKRHLQYLCFHALVKQVLTSLETTDEPGLKRLLICALRFPFKPAPSFRLTSCAGLRVK